MPIGPGKYDKFCTTIRQETDARGVIVLVIGGRDGDGFSCQADALTTAYLPELLEQMALEIRTSFRQGKV